MGVINALLALVLMYLCYQLALAFIGITKTTKQVLLPVLLFTGIIYAEKMIFNTTPTIHTIILVLVCGLLLWLVNKIEPVISFIGSLLSFTMLTLAELLISYPILIKVGIKLPLGPNGIEWIYVNLAEVLIIVLSIMVIKMIRFSITRYLPVTNEYN